MTAKIDSLEKAFDSAMVKLRFYNSLGPAKALSARRPDGEMTSVEKELLSANARLTAKLKMAELDRKLQVGKANLVGLYLEARRASTSCGLSEAHKDL